MNGGSQKGGVKLNLTSDDIRNIMLIFAQDHIPIPSQKRGTCQTDTIASIMWYPDEIRTLLWDRLIKDKNIDSACEYNYSAKTYELVECWIHITAARIATLLRRPIQPQGLALQRQPSATPEELGILAGPRYAVAEQCSALYKAYRMKLADTLPDAFELNFLERFGEASALLPSMINSVFQLAEIDSLYECSKELPQGALPLAIKITLQGETGLHASALCKIYGRWQYIDDNIGISIPLLPEYNRDDIVLSQVFGIVMEETENSHVTKYQLILRDGRPVTDKYNIYEDIVNTETNVRTWGERVSPVVRFFIYRRGQQLLQESVDPNIAKPLIQYPFIVLVKDGYTDPDEMEREKASIDRFICDVTRIKFENGTREYVEGVSDENDYDYILNDKRYIRFNSNATLDGENLHAKNCLRGCFVLYPPLNIDATNPLFAVRNEDGEHNFSFNNETFRVSLHNTIDEPGIPVESFFFSFGLLDDVAKQEAIDSVKIAKKILTSTETIPTIDEVTLAKARLNLAREYIDRAYAIKELFDINVEGLDSAIESARKTFSSEKKRIIVEVDTKKYRQGGNRRKTYRKKKTGIRE